MAWLVLVNLMGNNIKHTLSCKITKEISDTAAEIIYGSINTANLFQIYSKSWDTKQGYMRVTKHCSTLMELWQQIVSIYDDNWHCKKS